MGPAADNLIELFLPFDLDHAFSAGFAISLLSILKPFSYSVDKAYIETAHKLLDTLIAGGNAPAAFRCQELDRLQDMLQLVRQQCDGTDVVPLPDQADVSTLGSQESHGISPTNLLNIADIFDGYVPLELDYDPAHTWLWETNALTEQ